MKKQLVKFLISAIVLPLLREVLVHFAKAVGNHLLDSLKQILHKWKVKEEESAKSEEEKEIIRKKWNDRMNDVENLKEEISKNMDKTIDEALINSESTVKQIEKSSNSPKLLESSASVN